MPEGRAMCPACAGPVPLDARKVPSRVVPDGARHAPWWGPGEVVRRGAPRAERVRGRREVVQDLWVWEGGYRTAYPPFCGSFCAARYGLRAWREAPPLEPPRPALPAPEVGANLPEPPPPVSGAELAQRLGRLVRLAEGEPIKPVDSGEHQAARMLMRPPVPPGACADKPLGPVSPGFPGHPDWHPPGMPPPVPGVFRYRRDGIRFPCDPETQARRAEAMAKARATLAKQKAEAERALRRQERAARQGKPGRPSGLNGHAR